MKSEKEKMLSGEPYDSMDSGLVAERMAARELCKSFNDSYSREKKKRKNIINELIGQVGSKVWVESPFICDYGSNISLGDNVFINFNCVILDPAAIVIGSYTMLGPGVQILGATHPVEAEARRSGLESGKEINIGRDVWIGGNVTICPGVSIGSRTVIGAGSVVTKDIPNDVVAGGNPCRIIRSIK